MKDILGFWLFMIMSLTTIASLGFIIYWGSIWDSGKPNWWQNLIFGCSFIYYFGLMSLMATDKGYLKHTATKIELGIDEQL